MGLGRCERVRIERDRPARRGCDGRDVLTGVDARELFVRGDVRRRDLASSRAPAGGDELHDLGALGALGMAGRRLMLGEVVGGDVAEGTGSLRTEEIERLHEAIRWALRKGIRLGGASPSDYVDARGNKGRMQREFQVYSRAGEPCPRCGRASGSWPARRPTAGRSSTPARCSNPARGSILRAGARPLRRSRRAAWRAPPTPSRRRDAR